MNRNEDSDLIMKKYGFSPQEIRDVEANYSYLEPIVAEFTELAMEKSRLDQELNQLKTEQASLNFALFEAYSQVRAICISISGLIGMAKLAGISLPASTLALSMRLMNKYLHRNP